MIGGGDDKSARERWVNYAENSTIGSLCYAIHEDRVGHYSHAEKLIKSSGKATLSAGVTGLAMAATVVTGGLAAPLGVGAGVAAGATVGAATSAASTASIAAINDQNLKPGSRVLHLYFTFYFLMYSTLV